MRLADLLVQCFVCDCLRHKSETAIESLDPDELVLLAIDYVDVRLA